MAVSEEHQIGVAHISGGTQVYANRLADGQDYCGGVIHGIDLSTGETLYQIPNPWTYTGDDCTGTVMNPDTGATRADYKDFSTINSGICTKVGYDHEEPRMIHIDISPFLSGNITSNVQDRATFFAPVSIAGNLLFIPSATGDIFIHDVRDGSPIHIIRCQWEPIIPNFPIFGSGRRGIRAGVTVVEDRILFVCGSGDDISMAGRSTVHSWRLPEEFRKWKGIPKINDTLW